jgi:hypothetical protein
MKFTILTLCSLLCLSGCSQTLSEADLMSREKAETVLNSEPFNGQIKGNHIIFSAADKDFIVLVQVANGFKEYYLKMRESQKPELVSETTVELSNQLAASVFDKTKYKEGFITFSSDFYESGYEVSSGNITYFVFKDRNGERHGESRLSMLIKPNPIDSSIYSYFVKRMMDYNK